MQSSEATVVLLGTEAVPENDARGPGDARTPSDVAALAARTAAPAGVRLQAEEVARIAAVDVDWSVWRALAGRVAYHLDRSDVAGVVVAHGLDTLAETAYLLQRVLAPDKPVVLTPVARAPAPSSGDGRDDLADAVGVAAWPGARGVVSVLGGVLHGALDARCGRLRGQDTAAPGEPPGPLGETKDGVVAVRRDWPCGEALGVALLRCARPPRVAIVLGHGDADGGMVEALRAQGVDGIVAVAAASGRLHGRLGAALRDAQRQGGVRVMVCASAFRDRGTTPPDAAFESAEGLSPRQARIELLLRLLAAEA